ncbi:MAG: 30S ribosomal protein S20 [Candidatus Portnoybacteria bacterium]|nr:30S ribosomal protein S20 [Candidatus Portnoybacteria bacterium]
MPKLRSAKKQLRQRMKREVQNRKKKEDYRTLKRQVRKALEAKENRENTADLISRFSRAVDKAAKTGAIHRNKASREKSRLAGLFKKSGITVEASRRKSTSAKKNAKGVSRKGAKKKVSRRKGK